MSNVVSRTVQVLPSGETCTTTEFEGGFKVHAFSVALPETRVSKEPNVPRYQQGTAGFRRAMRIIDAKVDRGEWTADQGRSIEEEYITRSDREERS